MKSLTNNLKIVNTSRLTIPTSNWIDERVSTGGFPGHEDEYLHLNQLETLIFSGVNNIISLQDVNETPDYRDYKEQMSSIGTKLHQFHTKDNDILSREELQLIIDKINSILDENHDNIIYILTLYR